MQSVSHGTRSIAIYLLFYGACQIAGTRDIIMMKGVELKNSNHFDRYPHNSHKGRNINAFEKLSYPYP